MTLRRTSLVMPSQARRGIPRNRGNAAAGHATNESIRRWCPPS